jgi:hypothetical protein
MIKLRRMRWARHIVRLGEGRGVYRVLVRKPEGKDDWEGPGVDGRITLRWIIRKWDKGYELV